MGFFMTILGGKKELGFCWGSFLVMVILGFNGHFLVILFRFMGFHWIQIRILQIVFFFGKINEHDAFVYGIWRYNTFRHTYIDC